MLSANAVIVIIYLPIKKFNASFEFLSAEASFFFDVGIDQPKNNIAIYPNPSDGRIKIKSDISSYISKITVKDLSGKSVYKEEIDYLTDEIALDLSSLKAGIYFLSVENSEYTKSVKVILR